METIVDIFVIIGISTAVLASLIKFYTFAHNVGFQEGKQTGFSEGVKTEHQKKTKSSSYSALRRAVV